MKKILVSTHAIVAVIFLSLGLEKASAQVDPSAKPVNPESSVVAPPTYTCYFEQ